MLSFLPISEAHPTTKLVKDSPEMTARDRISLLLSRALVEAHETGLLPEAPAVDPAVDRPQKAEHGDFASSLPLKLARSMRMNPMQIAEGLASLIPAEGPLGRVWSEPPGFVNFSLSESWMVRQVEAIRRSGATYGDVDVGHGQRAQVEFVSVNPTGPLHVGHARGAVIGSALAKILEAAGFAVQREYYVNDAGNQMDLFNRSLHARYRQLIGEESEVPAEGYHGEYLVELAREIQAEEGGRFLDPAEGRQEIGRIGLSKMLAAIKHDLGLLRVDFDRWFSEQSLYDGHQYETAKGVLRSKGYLTEREGAVWFASTALGDDKDSVLVRSTGTPTYFASDVAYHYEKFAERGFDRVIDVWGADHQGHIPRMKAVTAALGFEPERLTLLIAQMVTLKRGGQVVKVSKRSGDVVTLKELVEEVGPDACRYFFLSRSPEAHMEFDLELAKELSAQNPVYYVQYAHARIASILRLAGERGVEYGDGDPSLLTSEAELALIRKMLALPELVDVMARNLEPHHLPHYALELATAFHWFYQKCRVVSSIPGEEAITKARLKLVDATRTVLARCLQLMIMEAPEQM